jgi:two-component system response regulator DesR
MPGLDGLAVSAQPRHALPVCRVIICTTFGRPGYLSRALAAGAAGFVVKDSSPEQLVDAIRRMHSGLRFIDPALTAAFHVDGTNPLTDGEADVLRARRGRPDRRKQRLAVMRLPAPAGQP